MAIEIRDAVKKYGRGEIEICALDYLAFKGSCPLHVAASLSANGLFAVPASALPPRRRLLP